MTIKSYALGSVLFSFLTMFIIAGCSVPSDDDIVVALIDIGQGEESYFATALQRAGKTATLLQTRNGTLVTKSGTKHITFITIPITAEAEDATKAAQLAITKYNAKVIIGGGISSTAISLAEEARNSRIPFLTTSARAHKITHDNPYSFGTMPNTDILSEAATYFILRNLKETSMAILYNSDLPGSVDIANSTQNAFIRLGGQRVLKKGFLLKEPIDNVLPSVILFKPNIIYIASLKPYPATVIEKLSSLGYTGYYFSGILQHLALQQHDNQMLTMFTHAIWNPSHESIINQDFIKTYKQQYSSFPTAQDALVYDTITRLMTALQNAQTTTPQGIRDALEATTFMKGVAGNYTFTSKDTFKTIWIVALQQGKISYPVELNPTITKKQ